MSLQIKYQSQRNLFWLEIDDFFVKLPPQLFEQSVLLKNNLATVYAETGQFRDILGCERDHPLLYLHLWLLDDWPTPASVERSLVEKHLFLAALFNFAAVYTQNLVLDDGSNFDASYLFLAQRLRQEADLRLAHLFSEPASFWAYQKLGWDEYAEATLTNLHAVDQEPKPLTENKELLLSHRLAFTKLPAIGAAMAVDRATEMPQLNELLDRLNFVWQIVHDISTLRHDLARRRFSYPILKTIHAAHLDPNQPLAAEQIVGALALTGVMAELEQTCKTQLASARDLAGALKLPTFKAHCAVVENLIDNVVDLFSIKNKLKSQRGKNKSKKQMGEVKKLRRPIFVPFVDTLPKVIEMAEGYLLSDLSFRESWEVQRRGVFGVPEMVGQPFPMGLITEVLAQHQHDMSQPIDTVFQCLKANGFRYYNHDHLPPDADDVGLALRLLAHSHQPEHHRPMVQAPVDLLVASISESGDVPVWLVAGAEAEARVALSLWGNSCVAVSANVLLGLVSYNRVRYQALVKTCGTKLFQDVAKNGVGAGWHYVPLYTIWIIFELAAQLKTHLLGAALESDLQVAMPSLVERFKVEVQRHRVTPQDAALLTLICLSAGAPDEVRAMFNRDWITVLCKSQRYDGSWPGEPLYGTPTRGELATWYASNSVTTALGYHALKTYDKVK